MVLLWYSISISLPNGGANIFNGYFSVNSPDSGTNKNIVTGFYETINGSTNFSNNILFPTGTGSATGSRSFNSYPIYNYRGELYDNVYLSSSSWKQFDINGVIIKSMSKYTQYDLFNLHCINYNDRLNTNSGSIGVTYPNNNYNTDFNCDYTLTSIPDPSCFNEGTKILYLNKNLEEEYIPIENLRKGDLVKSYKYGYRKIHLMGKNPMINNPERFNECMYKMEKTEENGLIEDLIVTGGHSILVDDLGICKEENEKIFGTHMIDDKYLLLSAVSKEFIKLENTNLYTYYHFILENDGDNDKRYGVWANGILTETPSKNYFTNYKYTLL